MRGMLLPEDRRSSYLVLPFDRRDPITYRRSSRRGMGLRKRSGRDSVGITSGIIFTGHERRATIAWLLPKVKEKETPKTFRAVAAIIVR